MKNRPFSVVFLAAVAASLLAQFGREIISILCEPADFRADYLHQLRRSAPWELVPYLLLIVLVPFVRMPIVSRWLLLAGLATVASIGVFFLSRLLTSGGDMRGLAAVGYLQMQGGAAVAAGLLALLIKSLHELSQKNVPKS